MNRPFYKYYQFGKVHRYFFFSEGPQGPITKMVTISQIKSYEPKIPHHEIYNLAFGDVGDYGNSWEMDDGSRSNNGDIVKVLTTVARIAMLFLVKNKKAALIFSGIADHKSNLLGRNQRNIIYQRIIETNWHELNKSLKFWGIIDNRSEDYVIGTAYHKILVQHK